MPIWMQQTSDLPASLQELWRDEGDVSHVRSLRVTELPENVIVVRVPSSSRHYHSPHFNAGPLKCSQEGLCHGTNLLLGPRLQQNHGYYCLKKQSGFIFMPPGCFCRRAECDKDAPNLRACVAWHVACTAAASAALRFEFWYNSLHRLLWPAGCGLQVCMLSTRSAWCLHSATWHKDLASSLYAAVDHTFVQYRHAFNHALRALQQLALE